jgi:hypothetical protein
MITPALAASPAEQRGKAFALVNCARCYSIDRVTQSPLKIACVYRNLNTGVVVVKSAQDAA